MVFDAKPRPLFVCGFRLAAPAADLLPQYLSVPEVPHLEGSHDVSQM